MPRRSSNKPKNAKQEIVEQKASEGDIVPPQTSVTDGKNPAAVALGRLGGKKGGKARAEKLTAKHRREIAKKAAEARWRKKQG